MSLLPINFTPSWSSPTYNRYSGLILQVFESTINRKSLNFNHGINAGNMQNLKLKISNAVLLVSLLPTICAPLHVRK